QIKAKQDRLADLESPPEASREAGSTSFNVNRGPKTDDIYDLSTVRGAFDNPAQARRELQERAKYAIERADYAERYNIKGEGGSKRVAAVEDMQENVSALVRGDHT